MSITDSILLINSIALFIFVVRNFILSNKLNKLESNINEVKHWINSIDMDSINTLHDKRYLSEARKFLKDM